MILSREIVVLSREIVLLCRETVLLCRELVNTDLTTRSYACTWSQLSKVKNVTCYTVA